MKLHNTLKRSVEDFEPQHPPKVTLYTCGPTVYDFPHIGNWYTFIRYDLLDRVLKANDYDVDWVMNITDVGHLVSDADEGEDKLEKGAKRESKTAWEVAQKYTDYFTDGMKRLNIGMPEHLPKATDHIPEQIQLIEKLEKKGHTYITDDGIYFDTSTFKDYGKMAQLDIENLQEGARVEVNEQKKNPTDFALWKFSPTGEKRDMEWDSPLGINRKGFPGWHLECSAMAMKYLGETIDIHAGGIDHIPVHHTNEIAQSEGATGKKFANYWLHTNFILVDGKKMSKSAGTFITLEDIEAKGFDLMAFRLMVMQSHYRTEAHFSWENLEASQNLLQKIYAWSDLRFQNLTSSGLKTNYEEVIKVIRERLSDDLNTPEAMGFLNGAINSTDSLGIDSQAIERLLPEIDALFGLRLNQRESINTEQEQILTERQKARDDKDWARSDELRDNLKEQGIEVRDTEHGQIWSRA
jgi:cysteinyl-tRNA synthetase